MAHGHAGSKTTHGPHQRARAGGGFLLGHLGAVLEWSWAVLGCLGAVLGRLGELKTLMTGSAFKRWTLYGGPEVKEQREGVWGREGAGIARESRAGG